MNKVYTMMLITLTHLLKTPLKIINYDAMTFYFILSLRLLVLFYKNINVVLLFHYSKCIFTLFLNYN